MKIVQLEDAPLVRGLEHRGGTFHSRTTAEGTPGTAGQFQVFVEQARHRLFRPAPPAQFRSVPLHDRGRVRLWPRWSIESRDAGLLSGRRAYGPQVNNTEIYCAVLQFGGASGSGYLLPREVKAGMEELKAFGTFKDGIFHRNEGVPGRRNSMPPGHLGTYARPTKWSTQRAVTTRRSMRMR